MPDARRARRSSRSRLLGALLAASVLALLSRACWTATFATPPGRGGGLTQKQKGGTFRTRSDEPRKVLEVPLPVEEEELPPPESLPERRVPYTTTISSTYPDHKHLPDEGATNKFILRKIQGALENAESLIQHVDVRVLVEEHFHKLKQGHKKSTDPETPAEGGFRDVAPYQVRVVVSLKRGKEVVFSNPEKHAQPTLREAVDAAADGVKRLMRGVKERHIQESRRAQAGAGADDDELDMGDEADLEISEMEAAADAEAAEEQYRKVEAAMGGGGAPVEGGVVKKDEKGRSRFKSSPPRAAGGEEGGVVKKDEKGRSRFKSSPPLAAGGDQGGVVKKDEKGRSRFKSDKAPAPAPPAAAKAAPPPPREQDQAQSLRDLLL